MDSDIYQRNRHRFLDDGSPTTDSMCLFLKVCVVILIINGLVGLLGFFLHLLVDLRSAELSIRDKFIYGAPLFAPLLFVDLALLGMLGIWNLSRKVQEIR